MPHKLLLADDSVTIQKVIELTFADEDIEVIAVSDGREAIERAPRERPDIVLADVGMPEYDGYDVAAFIKRTPELAHIPVLLLTGAFEPIDEGRARAAGCDGVLVKPFEPQMVITRVKDLIAGRRPTVVAPVTPAGPSAPVTTTPSVDAYLDRLDAAFSARESDTPAPRQPESAPDLATELARWQPEGAFAEGAGADAGSAGANAESAPPSSAPVLHASVPALPASAPAPSTSVPALAEAFAALLAAEQGKVPAPPPINEEALRDEVIEQVTRRVIEHMGDTAVREVVLDVAERLVREEIDRIKANAR